MTSHTTDLAATSELLAAVFPGSHVGRREYLEWLYVGSPTGAVLETNLDDEAGRAGHYAVVPVPLSIDGTAHSGALSLNTAVHERARGGGTFTRLAEATFRAAADAGIEAIVGVANANSTPGFVRRLQFALVDPMPVGMLLPTPGRRGAVRTEPANASAFAAGGVAADSYPLLRAPSAGLARRWTRETLRWRLAAPGARYVLHRTPRVLMVSTVDRRHGVNVAVLLKLFAREPIADRERRALVRAACSAHRAPLAMHIGWNPWVRFGGMPLPARLRASPLNLIYRGLSSDAAAPQIGHFELLDFDAY